MENHGRLPTRRMLCEAEAVAYDPHNMGSQLVRDFYSYGDATYAEWCWVNHDWDEPLVRKSAVLRPE